MRKKSKSKGVYYLLGEDQERRVLEMTDLKKLRELASKATFTKVDSTDSYSDLWLCYATEPDTSSGEFIAEFASKADADYFAAANPETVIALLNDLDTVQIVIADVESKILSYLKDCVGDDNCECGADDVQGFSVTCYLHAALVRLNQLKKVNHE